MAAPNILAATTITGKTTFQAVGTSATAILNNAAASGKLLKVTSLYISNVNGATSSTVNVDIFRGATAYRLAHLVTVAAGEVAIIITKNAPINLEEGDSLRLTAATVSFLEATVSYEEIV